MGNEEQSQSPDDESVKEEKQPQHEEDEEAHQQDQLVLKFMDSMDSYITLLDSLSSTLRQGWLDIASARHSMGASRINSAVFDLKIHSAATCLEVETPEVDSMAVQPQFTLCKWTSVVNGKGSPNNGKFYEDKLGEKINNFQLRHRGTSVHSEFQDNSLRSNRALVTADDQIQKERLKSLSVFGALISPKLRGAQLSFETALETVVEIANVRASMLSAFDQLNKDLEGTKG